MQWWRNSEALHCTAPTFHPYRIFSDWCWVIGLNNKLLVFCNLKLTLLESIDEPHLAGLELSELKCGTHYQSSYHVLLARRVGTTSTTILIFLTRNPESGVRLPRSRKKLCEEHEQLVPNWTAPSRLLLVCISHNWCSQENHVLPMRRVLREDISDLMLTEWFEQIPTCFKRWTPPPHEPWIYWHVRCLHEVHSSGREPWDPFVKLCFSWGHDWHEQNSRDFKGRHCE